jgi:hypothetical protein
VLDFLDHSRELFRQALAAAIQHYIPEGLRIPFAMGLIISGVSWALAPDKFPWIQGRAQSRELHLSFNRCMGVVMLIVAGILLEFS